MGLFGSKGKVPKPEPQVGQPNASSEIGVTPDQIPIETRIQSAIASKHGLYPHEILLLQYAQSFDLSGKTSNRFWKYRYNIDDAKPYLLSLQERGFIKETDLPQALERQPVAALKDVLSANGLPVSGKKDGLIKRALESIPESILSARFPERSFCRTEQGEDALKEEAYVPYIHSCTIEDLDIWSLNRLVHTEPSYPFRDKIWGYLNQRSLEHIRNDNFGLYRNCRLSMARFLLEEKKDADALGLFAEVVFYDLCGASNGFDPRRVQMYLGSMFPYENSSIKIAPGIITYIDGCQKELDYSDEQLRTALVERMSKISAPLQFFTPEECADIVLLERDKNEEALTHLYVTAKGRADLQFG